MLWKKLKGVVHIGDADNNENENYVRALRTVKDYKIIGSEAVDLSRNGRGNLSMRIASICSKYGSDCTFVISSYDVDSAKMVALAAKTYGVKTYHIVEPEIKNKMSQKDYDSYVKSLEWFLGSLARVHNELKSIRDTI